MKQVQFGLPYNLLSYITVLALLIFSNDLSAQIISEKTPGTYESLQNELALTSSTRSTVTSNSTLSTANTTLSTSVGLQQVYSSTGKYTLTADGVGSNNSLMSVNVNKPSAQATVQKAILISSVTFSTIGNGCVTLGGIPITWDGSATVSFFNNYWADVTSIVAPLINASPAGTTTLNITECNTGDIEGEALLVVFNDAAATEKTIIIMCGAMNPAGDNFSVTLAQPIDPSKPGALLDMGLGIGFGFQSNYGGEQTSYVSVNSQRITSSAGGEDDGFSSNGSLITVGGIGDLNTNPANPLAGPTNMRSDDELYNILPFINNTTTSLTINTYNPSSDDNIFLAYFALSGAAIIGEGVLASQTNTSGDVGTNHTVKASVLNSLGQPIVNRTVAFTIISGPNAGNTYSTTTNSDGEAFYTYLGNGGSGIDNIKACFTNSQNDESCSNTLSFEWIASAATITTNSLNNTNYCPGASLTVSYIVTGTYGPNNTFIAELSDASGSFTNSISIGSTTSTMSGSINATIPVNTPAGTGYRIRVISSDPEIFGADNGTDLVVYAAPNVSSLIPSTSDPIALGTPITFDASYAGDNLSLAKIYWGDGAESEISSSNTHTYAATGVYTVTAFLKNTCNQTASQVYQYVVVYDPTAGFITGGGWITSPSGAYVADLNLTGKASFGFVSKYQKGQTKPSGNTQFQFHAAGLDFKSTSYDWLVISGTTRGQFKGSGTINGSGNYGFLLSAVDGNGTGGDGIDRFRIKIWDKNITTGNNVVYDNQMGDAEDAVAATPIEGGSIVIHVPAKGKTTTTEASVNQREELINNSKLTIAALPNPSSGLFTLKAKSGSIESMHVRVLDVLGRVVETRSNITANSTLFFGSDYRPGIYFVEVVQGAEKRMLKLVKQ